MGIGFQIDDFIQFHLLYIIKIRGIVFSMITNFSNIDVKSYNNYSNTSDIIGKINILFGTNGSGKSALAQWIYQQDNKHSEIFNTRYVLDNIDMVNDISGIRLTVGKEAIENKEAINNIEKANTNIEIINDSLDKESKRLKQELYDFMQEELSKAKIQFSITKNINQKPNAINDPVHALELWKKEITQYSESSHVTSSMDLEQKIKEQKSLKNSLQTIFKISNTEYKELLNNLLSPILVPEESISQNMSDWLINGLFIHEKHEKGSNNCQFCGNQFDLEQVRKQITLKISSSHAKIIKELSTYEKIISESIENEKKIPELFFVKERAEFIKSSSSLLAEIKKKIKNTMLEIQVNQDRWENLTQLDNIINNKINYIDEKLLNYGLQLSDIESVAKSWIGKNLLNNETANTIIPEKLKKIKKKISENNEVISTNIEWILEQKSTSSDLEPFAQLVNNHFKLIGLELSLKVNANDDTYKIIHHNSNIRLLAKDLSEGERKLLAFLHFYCDIFDEINSSDNSIKQVIIDDPITSLDSDNRYYLTEIINNFIKEVLNKEVQVFIFTHSSMDYHNFGFSSRSNVDLKFWNIHKNEIGNSEIKLKSTNDLKNYSDYYHSIFFNVMTFALTPNSKIGQVTNHIHFGNQARLVLETHARSNYKIENVTSNASNILCEVYEISSEQEMKFISMLNVINSLSHGISMYDTPINSISPKEIRDSIRIMIGVLYKKDPHHIKKMAESILDRDKKHEISNWFK